MFRWIEPFFESMCQSPQFEISEIQVYKTPPVLCCVLTVLPPAVVCGRANAFHSRTSRARLLHFIRIFMPPISYASFPLFSRLQAAADKLFSYLIKDIYRNPKSFPFAAGLVAAHAALRIVMLALKNVWV